MFDRLKKGPVINVFTGKRPNIALSMPHFPCQLLAASAPALAEALGKITEKSRQIVLLDLNREAVAWCLRLSFSGFALSEAKDTSVLFKYPVDLNLERLRVLLTLGQRSFVTYALLRIISDAIVNNKLEMDKLTWIFDDPAPKLVRNFADHLIETICSQVLSGEMSRPLPGARSVPYFRRTMRFAIISKRPEIEKMFFEDHMPPSRFQIAFIFEFTDNRDIAVQKAVARGLLWMIRQGYSLDGLDHVRIRSEYPALDRVMKEVDKTWQWYHCTTPVAEGSDVQLYLYHQQVQKHVNRRLNASSTGGHNKDTNGIAPAIIPSEKQDDKKPTEMVVSPAETKQSTTPKTKKSGEKRTTRIKTEKPTEKEVIEQSIENKKSPTAEVAVPNMPENESKDQPTVKEAETTCPTSNDQLPSILVSTKPISPERKGHSVSFNLPEWTPEEEAEIERRHKERKLKTAESMNRAKARVEMVLADSIGVSLEEARAILERETAILSAARMATLEKLDSPDGTVTSTSIEDSSHQGEFRPAGAPIVIRLPKSKMPASAADGLKQTKKKRAMVKTEAKEIEKRDIQLSEGGALVANGPETNEGQQPKAKTKVKKSQQMEVESTKAEPVQSKSTEDKPAEAKSTEVKPADIKPNDVKPNDVKPTDVKRTKAKKLAAKPEVTKVTSTETKQQPEPKRTEGLDVIGEGSKGIEPSVESKKKKRAKARASRTKKKGKEVATA
jgi:hypothetical protein